MFTVAVLAATTPPASAPASAAGTCRHADAVPTPQTVPEARRATLCLINAERARRGLGLLHTAPALRSTAKAYARVMVSHDFFAHRTPGGQTLGRRIRRSHYLDGARRWVLGENLAWQRDFRATPRRTMARWLQSPRHRRVLLDRRFTEIGVGVAFGAPVAIPATSTAATYATHFGVRSR